MRNGPYILVVAPPDYPGPLYRGRYCYEHHLVWWRNTGEIIGPNEIVHHKNDDKHDNAFSNLEKKTRARHTAEHAKPATMIGVSCFTCCADYQMRLSVHKDRAKRFGHSDFCCSRSCQVKKQQKERWGVAQR